MLRAAARIVIGLWLLAGTAAAAEPARLALLIGNQAYAPSVGVLQNPHNDIAIVGAALARQGFTLLPPLKDATRVQILGAVRDLVRRLNQAGTGAVGFVYYSGHGAAEARTSVNYLIPVDAKKPGTEEFWDESVKLDNVLTLLSGAPGAAKFVVFDACRNELRLPYRGSKGFEPVRDQPGIFVAYTTAPGQPASDEGEKSGPYAAALAAELATPGLDHLHLFQRVKEAVYASTGGAQQPWESNGLFRLVPLTGVKKEPVDRETPPAGPAGEAPVAWGEIKDSKDIADFEAFRRQYGASNPFYDGLAAKRIEALKRAQVAINVPPSAVSAPNQPPRRDRPDEVLCDGLLVSVATGKNPCIKPGSGQSFKDCPDCPEMVVVPSGSFSMGSTPAEVDALVKEYGKDWEQYFKWETPQHRVSIGEPFAVGEFSITVGEYRACVKAGGCKAPEWEEPGSKYNVKTGSDDHYKKLGEALMGDRYPIVGVSWHDAESYAKWLSEKTGKGYRLLSEAEFEYAARAGSKTRYWWGDTISKSQANYQGSKTVPVKTFQPNRWGLYQVHGNVWSWTEDCWNENYHNAPDNGAAWTTGDCGPRVLRGGSWNFVPMDLRSADRFRNDAGSRYGYYGFRLARTLIS